jgi:hypothetical protein
VRSRCGAAGHGQRGAADDRRGGQSQGVAVTVEPLRLSLRHMSVFGVVKHTRSALHAMDRIACRSSGRWFIKNEGSLRQIPRTWE